MRSVALVIVALFALSACGDPANEAAGSGPDSPVSSSPSRPPPDDMATIPPTDQCPGAEVTEDGSGGDALQHERCPANDDFGKKYDLVDPRPGMVDVRPVPWAGIKKSEDGRALTVRFWSGVEPCNVLDHVDVDYADEAITITLFEGRDPSQGDVACVEMAVLKAVHIQLDSAVGDRAITDGAA